MGDLVEHSPESARVREGVVAVGVILVGVAAVLVGTLVLSYAFYRQGTPGWIPLRGVAMYPSLSALALLGSSAALLLARRAPTRRAALAYLLAAIHTALLHVAFVLLSWQRLEGLEGVPAPGAALVRLLTATHAIPMGLCAVGLAWIARGIARDELNPATSLSFRLWALAWHTLTVAWLPLFGALFLV